MKRFFLLALVLLFSVPVFAEVTYPNHYDNYVNDFADILSANDSSALQKSLKHLQEQTGIQLVIVTVNSLADYGASSVPFASYAAGLFDNWGIGDKNTNNGILIFFSLKDREVRIEMGTGYSYRYDNQIQSIVDNNMIPFFKSGEYSRGLYDGTYAVINVVTKQVSWFSYHKWHILGAVLIIICIFAGISCMKAGKKGWGYAFFAVAGTILLFLLKSLFSGKGKGGFGGGRSGGGGGGGRF